MKFRQCLKICQTPISRDTLSSTQNIHANATIPYSNRRKTFPHASPKSINTTQPPYTKPSIENNKKRPESTLQNTSNPISTPPNQATYILSQPTNKYQQVSLPALLGDITHPHIPHLTSQFKLSRHARRPENPYRGDNPRYVSRRIFQRPCAVMWVRLSFYEPFSCDRWYSRWHGCHC